MCVILFPLYRPHLTPYRTLYFWLALILIVVRGMIVSFSAAGINDESKKPLRVLRSVPSQNWNTEARRFFDEVTGDNIALSGMRFFFVTRKLILSVRFEYIINTLYYLCNIYFADCRRHNDIRTCVSTIQHSL